MHQEWNAYGSRRLVVLLLISLILFSKASWEKVEAASVEQLTLEQAVGMAVDNNREVKSAVLDAERAEDHIKAARTRRLPSLNIFTLSSQLLTPLSFTVDPGAFGTFPGTGPIPPNTTKLTTDPRWFTIFYGGVTQPLTQLFRINETIEALNLSHVIASEELRSHRHAAVNQVKRGYFAALQAQSGLEAADEAVKTLRELERVVRQKVEQQKAYKADLLEIKSRLAKAEYEAISLANTLTTRKEQLNVTLGRDVDKDFTVTMVAIPPPMEKSLEHATVAALKHRPEVKAAKLRITQAEHDLGAKKAEYIPDVSLAFNYLNMGDLNFVPNHVAMVGFQLNWEPFDWGRKSSEMAAKRRAILQANLGLQETESRTVLEINDRYRKLQESYTLLQVTNLGQEAASEKLRITINRYAQQAALLQEVLQAQTGLADANNQAYQALLSFWSASADIEKAMGDSDP